MKNPRFRLFIFTLILLLAITLYSIYQDHKNNDGVEETQRNQYKVSIDCWVS